MFSKKVGKLQKMGPLDNVNYLTNGSLQTWPSGRKLSTWACVDWIGSRIPVPCPPPLALLSAECAFRPVFNEPCSASGFAPDLPVTERGQESGGGKELQEAPRPDLRLSEARRLVGEAKCGCRLKKSQGLSQRFNLVSLQCKVQLAIGRREWRFHAYG